MPPKSTVFDRGVHRYSSRMSTRRAARGRPPARSPRPRCRWCPAASGAARGLGGDDDVAPSRAARTRWQADAADRAGDEERLPARLARRESRGAFLEEGDPSAKSGVPAQCREARGFRVELFGKRPSERVAHESVGTGSRTGPSASDCTMRHTSLDLPGALRGSRAPMRRRCASNARRTTYLHGAARSHDRGSAHDPPPSASRWRGTPSEVCVVGGHDDRTRS